jgi:hypothetical protein
MSKQDAKILNLTSVPLTREKQFTIREEFDVYASATNFVIKEIYRKHLTNPTRTIEVLQETFSKNYDSRAQYIRDVVKTARVEIVRHRNLAVTIRSMRSKPPFFKPGRMIFSYPIVSVDEGALVLQTKTREKLPIPFDKHSRNQSADILRHLAKDHNIYGRIRMTWNDLGSYVKMDIKYDEGRIRKPPMP